MGFAADFKTLDQTGGKPGVKPVGVRRASTFTGFCRHHDSSTFAPIEKNPFRACEEHCFLLAYRTLCRELYVKRAAADSIEQMRELDRGWTVVEQRHWQSRVDAVEEGQRVGLRDLESYKSRFDAMLIGRDFSDTVFYVLRIAETPDVLASFGCFIKFDFEGNLLQDTSDKSQRPDALFVSLIPTDSGGAIAFAWVDEQLGACSRFAESLHGLRDEQLSDATVRLIFEHSENTFFRPSWWGGLSGGARGALLTRFRTAASMEAPRRADCLVDDGLSYVTWHVVSRETNMHLR